MLNAEELDATTVVDVLRAATNKAANLIEHLDKQNENMRLASSGVTPDGTPVDEILTELRESRLENAKLVTLLRTISYETKRPASERAMALKKIKDALEYAAKRGVVNEPGPLVGSK